MNTFEELTQFIQTSDISQNQCEKEVMQLCKLFVEKWSMYTNEELLDSSRKIFFIEDSKKFFDIIYRYFTDEETLNEVSEILKNEESTEVITEANEYLEFIENLKSVKDVDLDNFEDTHSNYFVNLQRVYAYLEKILENMEELQDTLNSFGDTLERLSSTLDILKDKIEDTNKNNDENNNKDE